MNADLRALIRRRRRLRSLLAEAISRLATRALDFSVGEAAVTCAEHVDTGRIEPDGHCHRRPRSV
jgi:hypothetical protein